MYPFTPLAELRKRLEERRLLEMTPLERAVQWIKNNRIPGSGLPPHPEHHVATQEVTGYLIPTLYHLGEKELAQDLARWEASVQKPDGSFTAIDGTTYTFDTAQVIRGFLAVLDDMPELESNLRRACDFVESQIAPDGEVLTPSYEMWRFPDGSILSEYGNLYVLPPMLEAGQKLSEPRYVEAARRGMDYFRQRADLVEFKPELGTLSHYFGYMMEALVDLGEVELAKRGLQQAAMIQKEDGAIPAYPGVDWVCSAGVAQLTVAWFKLGVTEAAHRALSYLEQVQNPSGGFYGSYGEGATYFPKEEISWAVKFFLDCHLKRAEPELSARRLPS